MIGFLKTVIWGKKSNCVTLPLTPSRDWSGRRGGTALSWKATWSMHTSRYLLTQGTGTFWGWGGRVSYILTWPCPWCWGPRQRITNEVRYIMKSKGLGLVAYLDNMVSAEVWDHAQDCFATLKETLRLMGAVEAEHKSVSLSAKMVFWGVLFDTEKLTLEVSKEWVGECWKMFDDWLDKREVRRQEIESLFGKLAFMAACVRPGWLFMSKALEFLRGLPKVGKVEVPESVKRDLLWWRVFLPQYNGVSMMPW